MAFIVHHYVAQHIPRDLCNCRNSLSLEAIFLDEKDFMIDVPQWVMIPGSKTFLHPNSLQLYSLSVTLTTTYLHCLYDPQCPAPQQTQPVLQRPPPTPTQKPSSALLPPPQIHPLDRTPTPTASPIPMLQDPLHQDPKIHHRQRHQRKK